MSKNTYKDWVCVNGIWRKTKIGQIKKTIKRKKIKNNISSTKSNKERIEKNRSLIEIRKSSSSSSSEIIIENILVKNQIKFIREYYSGRLFNDKTNALLFFDFYLPDYKIVIEFDGIHHFKPINGEEALIKQKQKDKIKNIYCRKNRIKLLRIPYYKSNRIEDIILQFFDKNFPS